MLYCTFSSQLHHAPVFIVLHNGAMFAINDQQWLMNYLRIKIEWCHSSDSPDMRMFSDFATDYTHMIDLYQIWGPLSTQCCYNSCAQGTCKASGQNHVEISAIDSEPFAWQNLSNFKYLRFKAEIQTLYECLLLRQLSAPCRHSQTLIMHWFSTWWISFPVH